MYKLSRSESLNRGYARPANLCAEWFDLLLARYDRASARRYAAERTMNKTQQSGEQQR